jgi:hypothetical protein
MGGVMGSAVRYTGARFGRPELISLTIALAWAIGLIIAALVVPVYQSDGISSSGTALSGSATLVGENGWSALLVAGAPLVAAVAAGCALWLRAGRRGAGVVAWTIAGLLGCVNLLAMLSIGVFVLPVTIALLVACGTHGGERHGGVTPDLLTHEAGPTP